MQVEVITIVAITAFLCALSIVVGKKIEATSAEEKPKGLVLLSCWFVEIIDNNVLSVCNEKYKKHLSPYIGSIALFIFFSNIIGLLALPSPTSNYSVTLSLALITWITIQTVSIRENGIGSYLHGFIEPIVPFIIPNFFGKIAPLISMSFRLFGNVLSGSIIMSLLYSFTLYLSQLLFGPTSFNVFGPIIAPVLHAYFDIFSGFIQTFIFITLTMVFIGNEIPQE